MDHLIRFLEASYFNKILGVTFALSFLWGIGVLLQGLYTQKREKLQLAAIIGCVDAIILLFLFIGGYNLLILLIFILVIRFILGKL